jgi:hypothetical protein
MIVGMTLESSYYISLSGRAAAPAVRQQTAQERTDTLSSA